MVPSFDGRSVFYTFFHASEGADIFEVHVPTKKVTRLTHDGGRKAPGTAEPLTRVLVGMDDR